MDTSTSAEQFPLSGFGVGSWKWNILEGTVSWSQELRLLYGLRPDEQPTANIEFFLSRVHVDDRSRVMAVISETLARHRREHEHQFRIILPTGEIRTLLSRARLELTDEGKPAMLSGIDIDLGEANPDEALSAGSITTLRDTKRLFIHALQAHPAHTAVVNPKGTIILVNSAWMAFAKANDAGGSPLIDVGANYLDVCRAASGIDPDATEALRGISAVLRGDLPRFSMEYPCHSRGEDRWFLMTVVPLDKELRRGAIISHVDISAGRKAEAAVRQSEQRFRAMFQRIDIGLAELSINGKCLSANDKICRIAGKTETQILSTSYRDLVEPEDADSVMAVLEMLHSGASDICGAEHRFRRDDGTSTWVHSTFASVRDDEGKFAYYVVSAVDITDHKNSEQRQQTLLTETAHRSKNLLAVIQSIAGRTMSGNRALSEARQIFNGRLSALANSYDALTADALDGAPLDTIIRNELASFSDRVKIQGPKVSLTAKATQTAALLVHELATNASKHGALSGTKGHIDISWRIEDVASVKRLIFDWKESGGGAAHSPERKGFGTVLISEIAGRDFGCTPELTYGEDGFAYSLDAPLDGIGGLLVESPVRQRLKSVLVTSFYDNWSQQCRSGRLPRFEGFDWSRFAASGALTIARIDRSGRASFIQIGRALTQRFKEHTADFDRDVATDQLRSAYENCARAAEPHHEWMHADFGDGEPVTFERLLVPFTATGDAVTHVVGIVLITGSTDSS